ncbi:hypothetical protein MSAR_03170 [Mycolicibacterium sarraceniae]|uniref:Metallo-beta-lactamase domain-containing protein n=1 Tax=Mycolicibacterium sarraceniae TaxID=1534348 RepID=A0A7I7SLB0_9MYCO|nr:hypothetical protein MSAR_03170 [Mycolicibacterium sarraceniae]
MPTRYRNHNGYLLRWDDEGLLFDPGGGTRCQMVLAGVPASAVNRLCLTHFHGYHCLGVPGIIQRSSLDRVDHPISAHFPASGAQHFARLRHASIFYDTVGVREEPIEAAGPVAVGAFGVSELADGADMLVIGATFLAHDEDLAVRYGHLTARQAAGVAAACGVAYAGARATLGRALSGGKSHAQGDGLFLPGVGDEVGVGGLAG